MALEVLRFETIGEVDYGSVKVAMDEALTAAFKDMLDRPTVAEDRKVVLEIRLKPIPDDSGRDMRYAQSQFSIKKTFPAKGTSLPMRASDKGLVFSSDAPDNPDQSTLPFEDKD